MKIGNLKRFMAESGGDELFGDEMYLAGDTFVIPEPVHFLGTADRRAKYRKKQAALKKERLNMLDEHEISMQA